MGIIEGILSDPAGAGSAGGEDWHLILLLNPWRTKGAAWKKSNLHVSVPMASQSAASKAMLRYPRGTIIRVAIDRVHPASSNSFARTRGTPPVRKVRGDKAARAAVERLDEPKEIRDPFFGKLTLERQYHWFSTRRKIGGSTCELSIEVDDPDDDDEVAKRLRRARAVVERCTHELDAIRDAVTTELLPLYNDEWRGKRKKLVAKAFRARVAKLTSIQIAPTRVTLHFGAGGLFTDHAVEVRIAARGRISEILIA